MTNLTIRLSAKTLGVKIDDIAKKLGISHATMYRRLAKEMTPKEVSDILDIIRELSKEKE